MTMRSTNITVVLYDTEIELIGVWEDGSWHDPRTMPEDYDQAAEAWFELEAATIGGVDVWDLVSQTFIPDGEGIKGMDAELEERARLKLLEQEGLI